jgi:diguanylate cyclase (GGDEF)-like protein
VNDEFGHHTGDEVLLAFGNALHSVARGSDLVGRFGGEEFLLLMPDTELEAALEQAERLRASVEELVVKTDSGPLNITTSIGVAVGAPGDPLEEVVNKADQSLYSAKESGRNFVVS